MKNELSESEEQCLLFEWARHTSTLKKYPELRLMFCTGNGLKLSIGSAVKFKKQGNLKGVPDVILLVPKKEYHGLLIEMKSVKGKVFDDQIAFLSDEKFLGYKCHICYGFEDAKRAIENYLL